MGDEAAHRMADQHRLLDTQAVHEGDNIVGVMRDAVTVSRLVGIAVTALVEREGVIGVAQKRRDRRPGMAGIGGSVQEDDGWRVSRAGIDIVQLDAGRQVGLLHVRIGRGHGPRREQHDREQRLLEQPAH